MISFVDLSFTCYMILYGITLYSTTKKNMEDADLPKKDVDTIIKAQMFLDILYQRYLKHLVGWKKGSEKRMNQKFLLSQMHECARIFTRQNLHLGDLTDNQTVDVFNH